MKTVTVREFYHNAGLVDGLAGGKHLIVTANGKPAVLLNINRQPASNTVQVATEVHAEVDRIRRDDPRRACPG